MSAIIENSIRDHNAYLLQSKWDRDEIQHLQSVIIALIASNGGTLHYTDRELADAKSGLYNTPQWTHSEKDRQSTLTVTSSRK